MKKLRAHFSFFSRGGSGPGPAAPAPGDLRAGLTIEAALVLPLFLFMMYLLLFPLKVMEAERRLQNTMETVGKRLTVLEYVRSAGEGMLSDREDLKDWVISAAGGLEEGVGLGTILLAASDRPFRDPVFSPDTAVFSAEEDADPAMLHAELCYELDMPGLSYRLAGISKSLVVHRRAWTGSKGGRGRSKYGEEPGEGEEEEERMVYLGKTSTVYHEDPNCHYLSNTLQTADAASMASRRNEGGGKYHACPSCRPQNTGSVFFFANGSAYHASPECKAITAYARAVPLSEAEGMRPCSYCGKEHGT